MYEYVCWKLLGKIKMFFTTHSSRLRVYRYRTTPRLQGCVPHHTDPVVSPDTYWMPLFVCFCPSSTPNIPTEWFNSKFAFFAYFLREMPTYFWEPLCTRMCTHGTMRLQRVNKCQVFRSTRIKNTKNIVDQTSNYIRHTIRITSYGVRRDGGVVVW